MMENNLKPKISIIGCGNVGMRYAYALMIKGIARKIVMVDIDKKRIQGEVLDLSHGAPFITPVEIISGDYSAIKDSNLVVITVGKRQKPGQTRLDVAKDNVEMFREITPKITKYAATAIFLIASNPVDIISYAIYKLSGKNAKEIIGSGTVLDSARLRFVLAQHCNIDPRNIHAYILGEHGDTEVPIWSKAMIGGLLFTNYCNLCDNKVNCNPDTRLDDIFKTVRDSAYKIIDAKGETSYGIGLSLVRITQAILNDENAILPVSCYIEDYLGIRDVYLSLPAIINKEGIREILKLDLSLEEQEKLRNSARTLIGVLKNVNLQV
jgi:L-lactate dehydrogenase